MIPFMESAGGSCQDASMLMEVFAVRVKLVGGCEGTAIKQKMFLVQTVDTLKKTSKEVHCNLINLITFSSNS